MAKRVDVTEVIPRRKEEWMAYGVFMANVTDASPTPNADDRDYAIHGVDDRLSIRDDTSTTITQMALSPQGRDAWQKLIVGVNPTSAVPAFITPDNAVPVPLWMNERKKTNDVYERSVWYGDWRPSPNSEVQGDADSDMMELFSGLADVAWEFHDAFIASQRIVVGSSGTSLTGTLGTAFIAPNNEAVMHDWDQTHLMIVAISGTDASTVGNNPSLAILPYRDAAVSTTSVVITTEDTDQIDFTPTHVMVIGPVAAAGAGVYPNTTPAIDSVWDA